MADIEQFDITATDRLIGSVGGSWAIAKIESSDPPRIIDPELGVLLYYLWKRVEIAERALRLAFEIGSIYEGGRDLVRLLADKNLNTMRELVDYVDDIAEENRRLTNRLQEIEDEKLYQRGEDN